MSPFEWNFPTKLVYGVNRINQVGQLASDYGKKALIVSYRKESSVNPIVHQVVNLLHEAGIETAIFTGIEPNPRSQTVDKAIEMFKAEHCDLVIAVGGGSVIDSAKYIAATAYSGGSCWDYVVLGERTPREYSGAFPIIAIPTISAAGSESNAGGVIQNEVTNEKSFSRSPYRYPKIAIVDPEILSSVPLQQTKESCLDIFAHLIEHYLSSQDYSDFADRITEAMVLCLKDNMAAVVNNLADAEARMNIALCSQFGWSGIQALGRLGSIPMHSIQMPLSAHYDLPHARGMALVIPAYLTYMAEVLPHRWAKLARRCFEVTEQDDVKAARLLAVKVTEWLSEAGVLFTLTELGIAEEKFELLADDVIRLFPIAGTQTTAGARPLDKADIINIYQLCL